LDIIFDTLGIDYAFQIIKEDKKNQARLTRRGNSRADGYDRLYTTQKIIEFN
jgi:flagellar hook protein FlgE